MNLPSITVKKTSQIFLGTLTWPVVPYCDKAQMYLLPKPPLACSYIVVATLSTGLRLPLLHTSSHRDTTHALLFHFVHRQPPLLLNDSIVALAIVHVRVEFPYLCSCMSNSTMPKYTSSNCARVKEVCTVPLRTVRSNHMSQTNWTWEVRCVGHATDCPV